MAAAVKMFPSNAFSCISKVFWRSRRFTNKSNKATIIQQFYNFKTSVYTPEATTILMPAYSPTMTEGTIVKWLKKEGDSISPGEVLCELKTDKAVVSFEADDEGVLAKIIVPEGTESINIGTPIAVMVEEGDDWRSIEVPSDTAVTAPAPPPKSSVVQTHAEASSVLGSLSSVKFGPSVRKLLEEYAVSPSSVTPSGPLGNILKHDVMEHITKKQLNRVDFMSLLESTTKADPVSKPLIKATTPASKIESSKYTDTPVSSMRSTIAKRLSLSKSTIPHSYANITCRMSQVEKLRRKFKENGIKLSVNDFIIKAAAMSLQRVSTVNTIWHGDDPVVSPTVDVCVAVATDSGLIAPIVPNANHLGLQEISDKVKDLASRARTGKLKPQEYQGGSFSISNLGMYGLSHFTAVINPPQTAILAIGSSKLLLDSFGDPEPALRVQLSHDARIIDEHVAAEFLETFRSFLETLDQLH